MEVIEKLEHLPELDFPVVTSGTFDGLHYGHQKIIQRLTEKAKIKNGQSVLLTFWPHPRFILGKGNSLKLLSTIDEKIELIEKCGVDFLIKMRFTREFSELSSDEFIRNILVNGIGTKRLIIGYDHRFGRDREGGFEHLQKNHEKYGFEIEEIPEQDVDDVAVSSTRIREALSKGDVRTAHEYLTRPYGLKGIVTKGEQLGRKIGFPTANIYVPEDYKLIPGDGVYVVKVYTLGKELSGMLNIGNRPTVHGSKKTIEVNIFNFEEDIYGLDIEVQFVEKLRDEVKFGSLMDLEAQLKSDRIKSLEILKT